MALGPANLAEYTAPAGAAETCAFAMNIVALDKNSDRFAKYGQMLIDRAVDIARGNDDRWRAKSDEGGEAMTLPAARLTDMHLCIVPAPPPAPPLPPPGVPNPIVMPGAPTVLIGGLPAARMTDMAATGVPHPIIKGSATVLISFLPSARVTDSVACGGMMLPPCCPTVLIGG